MRRRILARFIPGLVAAGVAGAPAVLAEPAGVYLTTMDAQTPAGEPVLIRDGFTVPPGMRLLIDDMSVDCVIASEIFDEETFHQVGVEATAILRIMYPADAVRKSWTRTVAAIVRHRTSWSAPPPRAGWDPCSSSPARPPGGFCASEPGAR
jgi:hypothetical protein